MAIKPILTDYRGITFRSKLEARWAYLFDQLGLNWQYEPNGPATAPDFWFDDRRYNYLEVKGALPSRNCLRHMQQINCPLIAVGGFWKTYPTVIHVQKKGMKGLSLLHVFDMYDPQDFRRAYRNTCQHRFDLKG